MLPKTFKTRALVLDTYHGPWINSTAPRIVYTNYIFGLLSVSTQNCMSNKKGTAQKILDLLRSGGSWAKDYDDDGARMLTSLILNMTSSLLHSFFEKVKVIMVLLTTPWKSDEAFEFRGTHATAVPLKTTPLKWETVQNHILNREKRKERRILI